MNDIKFTAVCQMNGRECWVHAPPTHLTTQTCLHTALVANLLCQYILSKYSVHVCSFLVNIYIYIYMF